MLVLAVLSVALILIVFAAGNALLRVCRIEAGDDASDRFFLSAWIGTLAVAGTLMAAGQFVPLNRFALVAFALAGIAIVHSERRSIAASLRAISFSKQWWNGIAASFAIALGVSAFTTLDIFHFDTALYLLQQSVWLQEYGLVPGTGLLHHRLGYHSIWTALFAPLSDLSHAGRLHVIGGTFGATFIFLHAAHSISRIIIGKGRAADWFLPFAILPGLYSLWLRLAMVSSSPDLPAWILTIMFAWVLLIDRRRVLAAPAAMIACGAFAIKFSTAPLLVGALAYWLWCRDRQWQKLAVVAALGILTVGSVLAANFVSSGCILFPAAFGCLPVDWGVPAGTAATISRYISQWPLINGFNLQTGQDILAYARGEMPLLDFEQRLIMTGALMLPIERLALVVVLIAGCVAAYRLDGPARIACATAMLGLAYCLYVPSLRFSAGYFGILLGLTACLTARLRASSVKSRTRRRFREGTVSITAVLCLSVIVPLALSLSLSDRLSESNLRTFEMDRGSRLLMPPPIVPFQLVLRPEAPAGFRIAQIEPSAWVASSSNDVKFIQPEKSELCWNIRTPCAPNGEPLYPIQFRDPVRSYAGGFRFAR